MMRPWAPTASAYLLLFDLRDPKLRRRMERKLAELGFLSPQYSVRLAWLTPGEVGRLKRYFARIVSEDVHLILLPLGRTPPQAMMWGDPLGMSHIAWDRQPGQPPAVHLGLPDEDAG